MPALACGELCIPCLTRVPASETTATGMKRMSALFQRKNCHHCLSLFLIRRWGAWGEPLNFWRSFSAPVPEEKVPFFLCQHPQAQSVEPFPLQQLWESCYNVALKGSTCQSQNSKEDTVLCNKTLLLLVGKIFPQNILA